MQGKSERLKELRQNATKDFWKWFANNKDRFKKLMGDPEKSHEFLDELVSQIKPVYPGLKALAGPYDDDQYELVITADGDIAAFVKVEQLVDAAPSFTDWIITAHKPALGMDDITIDMYGHEFSAEKMKFYAETEEAYPDEVNIILVHDEYNEEEDENFQVGAMILLENALGELHTATMIDSYEVINTAEAGQELIPLTKLADYLKWREKEFLEKYENVNAERPAESWTVLEAVDENDRPIMAIVNSAYKNWEYKAAYPWLMELDIHFKGKSDGLPEEKMMDALQHIEDALFEKTGPGLLISMGHDTHNHTRRVLGYTHDYRMLSVTVHDWLEQNAFDFEIDFFIKRDKYWHHMDWFFQAPDDEGDEE